MGWFFLVLAVMANICANASLKVAMASRPDNLQAAITSLPLWIGLICCSLLLVFYVQALARLPMSTCYSVVTVLAMIGLNIVGYMSFDEQLSVTKIAGVVLASAGVGMMVWSS
jgi:multidrug transporter EmrE-like cation transporter